MLETTPIVLPYRFQPLLNNRIQIINPQGAKLTLHKTQITAALQTGQIYYRDLTSHERIMLEKALQELEK